jgi:acyl-coenzyme A synthetase/AMP-(fatty) acid ligase
MLTADEVEYVAGNAGAVAMVTDRATWDALHATLERQAGLATCCVVGRGDARGQRLARPRLRRTARCRREDRARRTPTRADDPAYLVYTSGTTGWPKGVLHAHRALLGRQPSSEVLVRLRPERRPRAPRRQVQLDVRARHRASPIRSIRGHTAIVCEGLDRRRRVAAAHRAPRCDVFIAVPTIYRQILQKTATTGADVPTLRHCMSAGEQLPAPVLEEWRARLGLDVYEGLGMTECSYYLCETRSRPIRPGSAGFAQPGHDITLRDPETWNEVPVDTEGVICIPRRTRG